MKYLLYLSALLAGAALSSGAALAQQYQWATSKGINYNDNPQFLRYSIAADAGGNVVQAGLKNQQSAFTWDAFGNLFVDRYDAQGNVLWQKQLTGNAQVNLVSISPAGDIYLLGTFVDSLQLDAVHMMYEGDSLGPGSSEQFLVSFDAGGNYRWSKNLSVQFNSTLGLSAYALAFDSQNNLYLGHETFTHSYVTKFDQQGVPLMTIPQYVVKRITSIAVDGAGNIYTSGTCGSVSSEFAGQPFPTATSYAAYLCKYTAAGQAQWVKWIEDISCTSPQVKTDGQGNVYFSHYMLGPTQFDQIQLAGPGLGQVFAFLARLDGAGNYQWVRQLPAVSLTPNTLILPGKVNFLDVDAAGNAYVAGSVKGSVDWGNGQTTSTTTNTQFFVQKINPQGQVIWVEVAGGTNEDEAQAIAVTPNGDVYITGYASQNLALGNTALLEPGTAYPFLAKISGTALSTPGSLTEELDVFPNPASSELQVKLPALSDPEIRVELFNTIGQSVLRATLAPTSASQALDITHLPSGSYLVRAQAGQRHLQRLIVKQ